MAKVATLHELHQRYAGEQALASSQGVLASGIAELDALLPDGGLPRGKLSELSGARSSGKRALALAFGAEALARGESVIWIEGIAAAPDSQEAEGRVVDAGVRGRFCPLPPFEHGAPLERLLVVRPPPRERETSVRAVYRAADLVLSSGAAATLLVLDLSVCGLFGARQSSKLARLSHAAELSGAALLFVSEKKPGAGSLGTFISLHLEVQRRASNSKVRPLRGALRQGRGPSLPALDVNIGKSKLGKMAHRAEVPLHEPHGLRLDPTV